jgi:hypothetical protein
MNLLIADCGKFEVYANAIILLQLLIVFPNEVCKS